MGCVQTKKPITPVSKLTGTSDYLTRQTDPPLKKQIEPFVNAPAKLLSNISSKIKITNIITNNTSRAEDNYKVVAKVGKGSFGSVYKVVDIKTGIIRAMKVIKKDNVHYQDDEKCFLKEIEILSKLEHPNIIKIIEYFVDDINYYVIMEYLNGGELYEAIIKLKHFNENKAANVMKQVLHALNYLHSYGIIHRDIKPENILVDSHSHKDNMNIKLIDFGTCNYMVDENKHLTLKVGSPYYIAPEVLKKKYNKKCDMWSAGVICYIMLMGFPPFKGKNINELFDKISKVEYIKTGNEWNSISANAKDFISKLLELDVNKRLNAQDALYHPWILEHKKEEKKVSTEILPNILTNIYHLNAREKLQQATIAYIVHTIDCSKEIDDLKKVFQELDVNGDGLLTYTEIKNGFEKYFGKSVSEVKMNKIIEEMDNNCDGVISYEEFLRVSINQKIILNEKYLKNAFDKFDLNNDGKLSKKEIKNVLRITDCEYVDLLLQLIDNNKDGVVSFDEFKVLMNSAIFPCNYDEIDGLCQTEGFKMYKEKLSEQDLLIHDNNKSNN